MSAIPTDEPAQDPPPSIDAQSLQQQLHQQQEPQLNTQPPAQDQPRKPKAPSVRRACIACHTGKTRCSEVLPCQSCLKRGLGATCAYPDPESQDAQGHHSASGMSQNVQFAPPPPMYATLQGTPSMSHQQYYDYNGTYTGASTSTFRPNKRPRNLTEEEAAAITRNFSRGDFFVGTSAPVRIDPRLPVRLTLGEGDHVHFTVGEALV
ncbi:hypothetical protein D9613_004107 [Agrocybe pediades]|uniref:Zn(2)-C6 fungal-type domain-containing protein n=1 Tax=Agrocybe pediades TaxID=84607 RepID=A0A8H4QJK7_9AGAR|nr:hypothetical protein D9613_004107 [Agrocybe pediades]KAF9566912.1 hypothetical protein CPC08DRAFT_681627 [Agrocybe pediades]